MPHPTACLPPPLDLARITPGELRGPAPQAPPSLGSSLLAGGDVEGAARLFAGLIRLHPGAFEGYVGLARCLALLGLAEQAARFLEEAVRLGFRDLDGMRGDRAFAGVRENSAFQGALERLRAEAAPPRPSSLRRVVKPLEA